MVKLVSIWMICSLASANRQQLVESQNPHVLQNVCMKTYRVDPESIYTETLTYDSLVLKKDSADVLKMYHYVNKKTDSSQIMLSSYDTAAHDSKQVLFEKLNDSRREIITVDDIEFPVYYRTWSMCPDAQCRYKHGHIQSTTESWYSPEFGPLITSGTYGGPPVYVTILIGYENNTLSGRLVQQLMLKHFAKDSRIFQKYQADYHAYAVPGKNEVKK